MSGYDFWLVDAFTETPLAGNPCAVVVDADDLDEDRMQAIATEMNQSETAFILSSDKADVAARYFTPAEEIPLAGHPTLAVTRTLLETGRLTVCEPTGTFSLELPAAVVEVEIEAAGELMTMTQPAPSFGRPYDPAEVMPVFGLQPQDALEGVSPQTVSTGTPQLMAPVRDKQCLQRAVFDPSRYENLKSEGDFFSPHLFCLEGFTAAGTTAARHFGVSPDRAEDPFTGSATGGMAAYLWRYGLISDPEFVAEQGHGMGRPGRAKVRVLGTADEMTGVRVSGHAVALIHGRLKVAAEATS